MEGVKCTAGVGSTEVLTLRLRYCVVLSHEGALTLALQVTAKHRTRVLSRYTIRAVIRRYLITGLEEATEPVLLLTGEPGAISEAAASGEALVLVVGLNGSQEPAKADAGDIALLAARLVTQNCQQEACQEW